MLNGLQNYLTFESIYLWANFGVLPFWLMIIFVPHLKITRILVNSIIIPLLLGSAYCYVVYQGILFENIFFIESFNLYQGLDNLYAIFSNEIFLLIFWLHFLALNIFLGSWLSRDAIKYNIPRGTVFVPIVLVYFAGPLGLVLYWFIRIFYAKKISLYD